MSSLRHRLVALCGGAALLTVAACSTGSTTATDDTAPEAVTSAETDAFPVTIEHAFGETTIDAEPERVVTVGWTDQDNVLALGVVPVGATKLTWGGNDAGSSDWFDAALTEIDGASAPTRYDDTDGVPVDEIALLEPDLILASNSGITEEEYDKLSAIADVVAYPDAPWVTPWRESLEIAGRALGRSDLAAQVAEETQGLIDAARADHPEFAGTSVAFTYLTTTDLSTIGVYGRQDPRVAMMEDLGFVSPAIVEEIVEEGQFYGNLSAERADDLDADLLLTYGETEQDLQTYADDRLLGRIPALAAGRAYAETDKHVGLAITNPTPLSLPYIAEQFLPDVAAALDG